MKLILKKSRWTGLMIAAFLMVSHQLSQSQSIPSREYQIKAVFLYNFAQFVEWPADAFAEHNAPLIIGVLGEDPFGNYLDETVKDEKVNGHPLVVKRFKELDEVKSCHILFVNYSKAEDMKQVFEKLKSEKTLTVGDAANFTAQGGMIRFAKEQSKTKIQVNLDVVKDADLTISSKLLRLAEIVSSQNN